MIDLIDCSKILEGWFITSVLNENPTAFYLKD